MNLNPNGAKKFDYGPYHIMPSGIVLYNVHEIVQFFDCPVTMFNFKIHIAICYHELLPFVDEKIEVFMMSGL